MEKNKIQILYIHGGTTFKNQDDYLDYLKTRALSIEKRIKWSGDYLIEQLKDSCTIIFPAMPLKENARYEEWKIYLERYVELLDDQIILIGTSLGGVFLAKYLSENILPKKIISVYLVCPPFDDTLIGEDLVGGFELGNDLSLIQKNCENVTLMFSKDDNCVPISHAEKYRNKISNANIVIYESKNGHFKVEEFPEIIEMIKNDVNEYKNGDF